MISSENKTVKSISPTSSKKYNWSRIRINRRKQQQQSIMLYSPTVTITCQKLLCPEQQQQIILPDLITDIYKEQKRQSSIQSVAGMLRKVGDELDDRLQKTIPPSRSSYPSSSSVSIQIIQYENLILQYVISFTQLLRLFL
ncbi:unnamed protein product [Didymodactylos carnosus]|uniref:Uncharacterized protein n=1 Tax=Didymodactylos carnosus TaxID=1234261 RepID=A0A8S2CMR5_9BILA|nr:unnamed protein product [Didymodactylos carnosus]CAF3495069.1 unnamed protein product [Didymodactylos carnosus]